MKVFGKLFVIFSLFFIQNAIAQNDAPAVEWKFNDIPSRVPNSPIVNIITSDPNYQKGVDQYDASLAASEYPTHRTGEDWWYSVTPDPATGGYIMSGFATWVFMDINETGAGGCLDFEYTPALNLSRPILSNETLSAKFATVALYTKEGQMVWCKNILQATEGAISCKVDTQGDIIVTGWTNSTRDVDGNPVTMMFAGGVEYDIASSPSVCSNNKTKPFIAKLSPTGNVLWSHLYSPYELGFNGMTNEEFVGLQSFGTDLVMANNGNYVMVGHQEYTYTPAFGGISRHNPFVIEVDQNGVLVRRTIIAIEDHSVRTTFISKRGTGYLIGGYLTDDNDIINIYNQSRAHGFCLALDANLVAEGASFGSVSKNATIFDGVSTSTQTVGLLWILNNYNEPSNDGLDGKTNVIWDAKMLANNNIALVDIYDCNGCRGANANRGIGELRIYDTNGSSIIRIERVNDNGYVSAFDLKMGLEADDPNEITLITTVDEGLIDPLDPVFVESMNVISGNTSTTLSDFVGGDVYFPRNAPSFPYDFANTSALLANYDINGNLRWEKIIDIDDAPLQAYPGDWKEQECVYQVIKDNDDGGYIFVGNTSHNKDDYLLAKVYGNCQLDIAYEIAPVDVVFNNVVEIGPGITNWSPAAFGGQTNIDARGEIHVKDGGLLLINDLTINFADENQMVYGTKLIIEPGGRVQVNNSTLTSNNCLNTMWTGIEVWGNFNLPQYGINQGTLILNNSTIENARQGVRLWEPNNWSSTGGILRAANSNFVNNILDVEFIPYNWSLIGVDQPNKGNFDNCSFITDDNFLADGYYSHVTLYDVKGVNFFSCDFTDSRVVNFAKRGRGIVSIDAKYKVLGKFIGTSATLSEYYDPLNYDGCTFTGLKSGVEVMNVNSQSTVTVDQASFLDCQYGVRLSQVDNAIVTRNRFDRTAGTNSQWIGTQFDIYTDKATAYLIEGNVLENQNTGDLAVGISIENSGLENNEVFKNQLTDLDFGSFSFGKNRNDATPGPGAVFKGLEFLCNQNTNNSSTDELILGSDLDLDGIKLVQGAPSRAAGNTFSVPSGAPGQWHLRSNLNASATINYNWYQLNLVEEPTLLNGNVNSIITSFSNSCPTSFNVVRPGPGRPIPNDQFAQAMRVQFNSLASDYTSKKATLTALELNGDRQELHDAIANINWWNIYSTWELLHDEAPYLSEQVLRELGAKKPWEFPSYFLKHLIIENIEVAKNPDFMQFLLEKEYPVSSYYYSQIMLARDNSITDRGVKQGELLFIDREKNRTANLVIKNILQDSLGANSADYSEWVLKRGDVLCELQLIDNFLDRGQKSNCSLRMAIIDGQISQLTAGQLKTELADYYAFKSQMLLLTNSNGTLQGLDSISEPMVRNFAENATGYAQVQAQNLLCFFRGECKSAPVPTIENTSGAKLLPVAEQVIEEKRNVKTFALYPNPAHGYVVLDLQELAPNVKVKIIGMNGKIVYEAKLSSLKTIIDTSAYQKGVYLVFIQTDKDLIDRAKLIIQ